LGDTELSTNAVSFIRDFNSSLPHKIGIAPDLSISGKLFFDRDVPNTLQPLSIRYGVRAWAVYP
jgi:hypothetical protein